MKQNQTSDDSQSYSSKKANSIRSKLLLFSHIQIKTEQKKPTYQSFPSFPTIEKFFQTSKNSSKEEENETTFISKETCKMGYFSTLIKTNKEKTEQFFSPFSHCSFSTASDDIEEDNNEENIFINTKKVYQVGKVEHKQNKEKFHIFCQFYNESLEIRKEENDERNSSKKTKRGRERTTIEKEIEEIRKKINKYFKEKEIEKSLSEKGFSFLKNLCGTLKKPKRKKNKIKEVPECKTPKKSLFCEVTKFPISEGNQNYNKNTMTKNTKTNTKTNTNPKTKTTIYPKKIRCKSRYKTTNEESKEKTLKISKRHKRNLSDNFDIIILKPMYEEESKEKGKEKKESKTKKRDINRLNNIPFGNKRKTNKNKTEVKSCFNCESFQTNKKENKNKSRSKNKTRSIN